MSTEHTDNPDPSRGILILEDECTRLREKMNQAAREGDTEKADRLEVDLSEVEEALTILRRAFPAYIAKFAFRSSPDPRLTRA